jgi:acetyl esterase/lipase
MMLDLRSLDELQPQGAALVYGVYCGEEGKESHRLFGQGQFGLTTERMTWFLDNYRAEGHPEFARPRLFPVEADLHDLPPLLLVAAELDPLRGDMQWFWQQFIGGHEGRDDSRIAPLRASAAGLPPAHIIAAELDPLRDDSIKLARKLAQTNTPFEFRQVAGVIHNFLHWSDALPEAVATLDNIAAFMQSRSST